MTTGPTLRPHDVVREDRADGSIVLRSQVPLGPVAARVGDWLDHWAKAAPERAFLAERQGAGWREVTYGQAALVVRAIASHLLRRDLGPDRPVMVLSGNGVDHGLLALAAQYVGIPVVPVAEQYSLIPDAHPRLAHGAGLTTPGLIFATDGDAFEQAMALEVFDGAEKLTSAGLADWMTPTGADVTAAARSVTHDTLAKVPFTSGSTSDPKGVLTTHGMLTTNQAQIGACLPFLSERPPVIVDWLPWNHTFGGSHNFNMILANGGSLYIDDGKPAPGLFDRTVENLRLLPGTISFNVPVGFTQLVSALEADAELRETYFANLDMIFFAGASLPRSTWDALSRLAAEAGKAPLITTSWGMTETAPGALIAHEQVDSPDTIGVPLPEVEVKLLPLGAGRYDLRARGPSITPGYLKNAEKTAAAFDDEGYFITEDALELVDESDPNKGVRFDGRLSEDFKLTSGTWVQTARLRLQVLEALAPFAQDAVITGAGRDEVAVLILPNRGAIAAQGWEVSEADGLWRCAELEHEVQGRLADLADRATGSATRVTAALILADPPSMATGEATAKGNINFPKFLAARADMVERLYNPETPGRLSP